MPDNAIDNIIVNFMASNIDVNNEKNPLIYVPNGG